MTSPFGLLTLLCDGDYKLAYEEILDLDGSRGAKRDRIDIEQAILRLRFAGRENEAQRVEAILAEVGGYENVVEMLANCMRERRVQKRGPFQIAQEAEGGSKKERFQEIGLHSRSEGLEGEGFSFRELKSFEKGDEEAEIDDMEDIDWIEEGALSLLRRSETWAGKGIEDSDAVRGGTRRQTLNMTGADNSTRIRHADPGKESWTSATREAISHKEYMMCQRVIAFSEYVPQELENPLRLVLETRLHKHERLAEVAAALLLGAESDLISTHFRQDSESWQTEQMTPLREALESAKRTESSKMPKERVKAQPLRLDSHEVMSVDPGLKSLLRKANEHGKTFRMLSTFAELYSEGYLGIALAAVSSFISEYLDSYASSVLSLFEDEAREQVNVLSVMIIYKEHAESLNSLFAIVQDLQKTRGTATEVLDILYGAVTCARTTDLLRHFFLTAASPFFGMVWDWSFRASVLSDVRREFFGTSLGLDPNGAEVDDQPRPSFISAEDALKILRAGRARALLTEIDPSCPSLKVDAIRFGSVCSFDDVLRLYKRVNDYACFVETGGATDAKESCKEPVDSTEATESPDSIKATAFALRPEDWCTEDEEQVSNKKNRSFSLVDKPLAHEVHKNRTDVVWPPLSMLLRSLVISPILRVDAVIQRKLLNHMVCNVRVDDHLKALWRYALLGAGDFATSLVEAMDDASRRSVEVERFISRRGSLPSYTFFGPVSNPANRLQKRLAESLRAALRDCATEDDDIISRISLVAKDPAGNPFQSKSFWENDFKIEYDASFPLDLIINEEAMGRFVPFFNLFVRIRLAKLCLRRLFLSFRRRSYLRIQSKKKTKLFSHDYICRKIWRFCWEAEHFVSIISGYEYTQVHGSAWTSFCKRRGNVYDVWELRDSVLNFLADAKRQALLEDRHKIVMDVITGALDAVINLESKVIEYTESRWRRDSDPKKELSGHIDTSSDDLRRRARFLVAVLEKLRLSSPQPHFSDLLCRLNWNYFYSQNINQGS